MHAHTGGVDVQVNGTHKQREGEQRYVLETVNTSMKKKRYVISQASDLRIIRPVNKMQKSRKISHLSFCSPGTIVTG